jgi:zinc protease
VFLRAVSRAALLTGVAWCATAAVATAQSAPAIPHERFVLPNGLEVLLHQDRSTPVVAVNVYYKVGSGDEKPGRTGFAHLFEHVMFMGSQHVPVGKFDQWLEAAGGNNNGTTNQDRTNYFEWMPSNALPLALWLEADRMGYLLPTMDQAKLDLQRDVVKNERRQSYDNQPYGRAYETILGAMYPSTHPYSWPTIGSMADLSAAKLDDVKDFFRTYYAPNNALLAVAGDFDVDSAKTMITTLFGGIPRGPAMPARPAPAPITAARDTFLTLEDRVQLPRLYVAWHTVKGYHTDDAALDVLGTILGQGKTSRLYERLVYREQVAQNVSAYQGGQRLAGMFQVSITPRPGQRPAAMAKALDEELKRIVDTGVTDREVQRAIAMMETSALDRVSGVLGKADQLNAYLYETGDAGFLAKDLARYRAVTAADVQRVARAYLLKPRLTLTVVPQGKTDLAVTGVTQ